MYKPSSEELERARQRVRFDETRPRDGKGSRWTVKIDGRPVDGLLIRTIGFGRAEIVGHRVKGSVEGTTGEMMHAVVEQLARACAEDRAAARAARDRDTYVEVDPVVEQLARAQGGHGAEAG